LSRWTVMVFEKGPEFASHRASVAPPAPLILSIRQGHRQSASMAPVDVANAMQAVSIWIGWSGWWCQFHSWFRHGYSAISVSFGVFDSSVIDNFFK
jgi:hypothetical protein